MNIWPLRFRQLDETSLLFADDAGSFFCADNSFLARYAENRLTAADLEFLKRNGHAFRERNDLSFVSFAYRWSLRHASRREISYIVLVPTLRCNLSCSYCQVARADERATGYDWSEETLAGVLTFLNDLNTTSIKIEFQGGEPLLRLDLLKAVRDHCRRRFATAQFVVCTNLQHLSDAHWEFLDAEDTWVSTSLDGDYATHQQQRTRDTAATNEFFYNLEYALMRLSPSRVSALPTINIDAPPLPETLIDAYVRYGLRSIYLRPINFQGFARKTFPCKGRTAAWSAYHSSFIDCLVSRNFQSQDIVEEFYFTHCLRRIFQSGMDGHVDLRNPNLAASEYMVIDYDGTLYPSDESRMLARVNHVDLSIGHVTRGVEADRVSQLNANAFNDCDPDCVHCAYQPYCGIDIVDDLSRYGRIDVPRHSTWFCSRQMAIFDKAFSMIYSDDPAVHHSLAAWLGIEQFHSQLAPRLP